MDGQRDRGPGEPTVLDYRRPAAAQAPNPDASRGLLWGLLLPVPFAGALAVHYGRRGLRAAREEGAGGRGRARAAVILGGINLALSAALLIVGPIWLIEARRQAQVVACMANLRQIGLGMMVYANANNGFFPASLDALPAVGVPAGKAYECPACAGDQAKPPVTVGTVVPSHYVFALPLTRVHVATPASAMVLAYEPLTNHDGRGINVLFADGHAEWLSGPAATAVLATVAPSTTLPVTPANIE
jgi:prepilin-type processing-associated H-X9-DG protein